MDLRKPGEEADDLSELSEDSMEPEDCFPQCEHNVIILSTYSDEISVFGVFITCFCSIFLMLEDLYEEI